MELDEKLMDALYSIDWFSNCGKAAAVENAEAVASLSKLKRSIRSIGYENAVLDRQGDFTAALCASYREEYNKWWNVLAGRFKAERLPKLLEMWENALAPLGLNEKYIINDISFNVLNIAVIDAYKEQLPTPDFFKAMLAVYRSGRLICGWTGSREKGKFLVY